MIKITDLSYRYSTESDQYSIKNLNLEIQKGEFVVLCGRSGCGKTTVTRLINGLIPHLYEGETTGSVEVAGKQVADIELSDLASVCGSVFQSPKSQFFNTDTTGELAFGCENLNFTKEQTAKRLDKTVDCLSLQALMDRDIFKLSGGEKQQIACGSIYATDPDIYVLDEPSSNMDAAAIMRLKRILTTLKQQGKTVIISEHRLCFLMELADRFLYFADGALQESFTSAQLRGFSSAQLAKRGFRATDLSQVTAMVQPEQGKDGLRLQQLSCVRAGKQVLAIDDLTLPAQSIVAIIGENGAGKSTFAEVVTGLLKAKGDVTMQGKRCKPKSRTEQSYMVMQDVNRQLFCSSVKEEISLGAKLENIDQVDELMKQMDIADFKDRHPASLSGGQKQRVAICAAIAAQKQLMFYDEPTSGLDYVGMHNLCKLILARREKHLSTMIITHDMELIFGCCTHVLQLKQGKLQDFYSMDQDGIAKLQTFFTKQ